MLDSMCDHPDAERLMLELAAQLETVKGKKSYGYLPKRRKKLVEEIVSKTAKAIKKPVTVKIRKGFDDIIWVSSSIE